MRYLLSGVAAIAMMTACDQSGGSEAAPLEEITLREGDPADAPDVISAMMLTNSGDGALAYESKDVDGANATFSNVSHFSNFSHFPLFRFPTFPPRRFLQRHGWALADAEAVLGRALAKAQLMFSASPPSAR